MKLPREFIRLPVRVDAERLAAEVEALPDTAWMAHPTGFAGNSAVPLIAVNGEPNDLITGPMAPTAALRSCPYTAQVLESFGVVFGRSRLMRLAGGAEVPSHCDVNYHWFTRVRIHIPIITFPEVEFHCGDQMIHMAAGEAWIFDNWKMHRVVNPTDHARTHLVADTCGSAAFWGVVDRALETGGDALPDFEIPFDPARTASVPTERYNAPDVLPPQEIEWLAEDLLEDLASGDAPATDVGAFSDAVRAFYRDWRMLWATHGPGQSGWSDYERLRNAMLQRLRQFGTPLTLASNGRPAQNVLLARVLVPALRKPIPGLKTL